MSLHTTPVAHGYRELFALIRATADALPEDPRAGVDLPEFRELAPGEPVDIVSHYAVHDIPGRRWCESLQAIAKPMVPMHGPRPYWGLIVVRYELDGARGSFKVARSRAALLRLAEKIGTLPGARAVLRAEKPAKARPAVSWPAVSVKVWRELIEDGAPADALALGREKLGARFYQGNNGAAFMIVAPVPIEGMPEGFATGRRDDGKWVGFDTLSGRSIGCNYGAHGSRNSAAAAALAQWQGADDDKRAHVLAQARESAADADEAAALAEWCKARGLADAPADPGADAAPADLPEGAPAADAPAPVDAAADPAPADDAPVVATAPAAPAPAAPDPIAPAAGQPTPAAIIRAADALARISADWAPDAGRSHAMATGRAGLADHLPRILADLTRASVHGFGLERSEARRALAEFEAAARVAPAAPAAVDPAPVAPAALADAAAPAGADLATGTPCPGIPNDSPTLQDPAGPLPAPGEICTLIVHNAMAPIHNAAAGGAPDPSAILAAADRSEAGGRAVLADCAGLPTEAAARQTLANCLEVARQLRAMVPGAPCPGIQNPETGAPVSAKDLHPLAVVALKRVQLHAELADETRSGRRPDGYLQMLIGANEKSGAQLAAAFAEFDKVGDGTELANEDGRRFCVLVPDASQPGRYRYSVFDASGFSTHHTEKTAAAAVADAAWQGFTIPAPGVLDRLAAAPEWARGMACADVIQRQNAGRLTWQQAHAELDRIRAEFAAAAAAPAGQAEPAAPVAADATPCRAIQDGAPAAADPMASPARELSEAAADWLARVHKHLATDPRPRLGHLLAAQKERTRAAAIAARDGQNQYSAAAAECAAHLQALADAMPEPPAADPARIHPAHDWAAWRDVESGRAEPTEYQAHVIECEAAARAQLGDTYNATVWPRTAALMAARYGYPDARRANGGADGGTVDVLPAFGSHCYSAASVSRARAAREAHREAREALRLAPGVKLGALVFNDGKLTRGAEVSAVSDDGELVTIKGNRGAAAVQLHCAPLAVRHAIDRAQERGKRRDTAAEFCAGRAPAPAPAAPDSAAGADLPADASLADRILAELTSRAPGDIVTGKGFAHYCGRGQACADEVARWQAAALALADAGQLVRFVSPQGLPDGFALPYVSPAAAPADELACLARVANARSASAADELALKAAGTIEARGRDGWLSLTRKGADMLSAGGYVFNMRAGSGWMLAAAPGAAPAQVFPGLPTVAECVQAWAGRPDAPQELRAMAADDVAYSLQAGASGRPGDADKARFSAARAEIYAAAADALQPAPLALAVPQPRQPAGAALQVPGQGPAHARQLAGTMPAAAGAWRAAPVAAGVAHMLAGGRREAARVGAGGPTCHPWRSHCSAGQLARPPPGR